MEKKVPMRTCIACRQNFSKKELNRIVKSGETIFFDPTGKANGRGAYVCNNPECASKLKKQKILNKVFSCNVEDSVYQTILEALIERN